MPQKDSPHVERPRWPVSTVKRTSIQIFFSNYWTQVIVLGFVAFGSRGVWAALNALGGAGTNEVQLVTIVNVVFSASYCAFGWLGGGVVNLTGPRVAMLSGTVSIALLITLLYLYAFHRAVAAATIVAAAWIDGIGSVFLWSAVSYVLLFYPRPSERGRAMTVFNFIYNSGAVMGAVLTALLNRDRGGSQDVGDDLAPSSRRAMTSSSYLTITLVTYFACLLCGLLKHPQQVTPKLHSLKRPSEPFNPILELKALWFAATHKYTYYLAIFFVVTTWHLVFLFNWINAGYFNVRSRATNSAIYWGSRILATVPLQCALDSKRSSMRVRGLRGFLLLVMAWTAATSFLLCVCLLPVFGSPNGQLDVTDAAAIAPLLSFAMYGALDTIAQSYAIWLVGALPLDAPTASRICGMYRSFQGMGQMLSWILDVRNVTPYRWQFGICTALWAVALVPLLRLVLRHLDPFPEEPFALAEKEPVSAQTTGRSII